MPDLTLFEARLTELLEVESMAGVRPIDRHAIARSIVANGPRRGQAGWFGFRRYLVPVLIALLLLALAAGVIIVGSRLLERRPNADTQLPAVVAPSPSPLIRPTAAATAAPVAQASIGAPPQPDPSQRPPANQPCAAMLHQLPKEATASTRPIPALGRVTGNGHLLVSKTFADGSVGIERFDPSTSPPVPVQITDGVELPFQAYANLINPLGRRVLSADGRALAIEAGDFDLAGCGDPVVVTAAHDLLRPFPGRAFELISGVAWAPDGSALYGIRRPTLDARGQPYTDSTAPGRVVRWDTTTTETSELSPGCEACGQLFVSPDGSRIAALGAGGVELFDAASGWRELALDRGVDEVMGWADDRTIVLRNGSVNVDGEWVAAWEDPDIGNGPLSPDATTMPRMTSAEPKRADLTLINVRDGSMRIVWSAPIGVDCSAVRFSRHERCVRNGYVMPGPDTVAEDARVVAWAPDNSAVLLLDRDPAGSATLRTVRVDGSGASDKTAAFDALDPPSVVWLPQVAAEGGSR